MTLDHRYNVAYWVDILSEQEFIHMARNYCTTKGTGADVINWLYKLGRDSQKCNVAYDEFVAYMKGDATYPRTQHRPYRYRGRRDCGYYREGTKYRKNVFHQKKEKSQKQIWREISGIARDKSKRFSWSSARKACARRAANGAHRQWVKRMICNEKFDSLYDTDWKWFHDPWDWD